ncbi:putative iron-regulated membrane protein [Methylobacterium sp. PvP062]|uniref:Sulfite reductase (NADPH) flavoprotein alpha-component n=1 Tax=Methylobacterium radiotolerans TaxID=31998 RepID=A0ABV2NQX9_9HYPH|nr:MULTISPECIES: PepSY-associated TM helix domain-containing protein [unclassified Methylobacterium]MBP2494354.1 sulfite reductase (NADPH) flavoprotein alpha-component [Methylobacterium sp. PvP105]MBP2499272.1 sulfite reductase (NADPH) flavoprotein alpha-component [Methylobacterium sp. PvP109]MCX7331525.1 PepSY-associated TM helix domain-containing protein [Hyphomicrobiales bacterium]
MTLPIPSLRTLLFRLHWALGLTAGLVLALMGLTGALMSYEEAVTAFANRDRLEVAPGGRTALAPAALAARIDAQAGGRVANVLTLSDDPRASVHVRFARDPETRARPPAAYADPYDGALLGPVRLEGAFTTVRDLHRWLLLPGGSKGWGRTVTGACTLALLAFLATGLYLRWPRIHRWRIWLKPALSRPGRPRWWSLHAVVGTWLLPVYLVIALSGLTWSYPWFKDGATRLLAGAPDAAKPAGRRAAGKPADPAVSGPAVDRAWADFRARTGAEAGTAVLTLPGADTKAIRIRWLPKGVDAPSARNEDRYDPATGALLASERAADAPLGRRLLDNVLEVHRGRFFGDLVALLFCLAALAMPGFAATGLTLYVLRRRAGARRRAVEAGAPAGAVRTASP